jgi:peptidoglycan/LPS O-acetylase OafA/YrhL
MRRHYGFPEPVVRNSESRELTPEAPPRHPVRRDVQGLRALAVVAVILNHLTGWPVGGFIGVDVFFVLSGYLITGLLLREHERSGTISFSGFYKRRIKRIMPAAVLVLLATVLASWVLTPGVRFLQTLTDSFWSLLFVSNWNLALQGADYFQQDLIPSPVQHYWSLAVEEQFYLVWPWLMLGVLALGVKLFSWSTGRRRLAVGLTIGVVSAGSFGYALFLTATDVNLAYFSSVDRAWELGVGALVAVFGTYFQTKSVALRTVLSWLGFLTIVAACFVVDPAAGFPAPLAALPVLATAMVLLAGEHGTQPYLWPLTNPASRYVGDISYSLYLWHFPVLILLLAVMPGDSVLYYAVAAGLIVALSVLSYHLVEDPIRRSGWLSSKTLSSRERRRRRKKRQKFLRSTLPKIALAAVLVGATTAVVVVALNPGGHQQAQVAEDGSPVIPAGEDGPIVSDAVRCRGAAIMDPQSGCSGVDLGDQLDPAPAYAATDKLQIRGKELCWINLTGSLTSCHYGNAPEDATKIAIVGDSHAQSLMAAIIPESGKNNWSLNAYTGDGCILSTRATSTCGDMQPKILEKVASGDYDVVITTSSRAKTYDPEAAAEAYRQVLASGTRLIVFADVPGASEESILCYQRVGFDVRNNDCGTPLSESRPDAISDAAPLAPGTQLFDLTSLFCADDFCPAVVGNVPVYRDSGAHITATYAGTLSPYVVGDIVTALTG